jgi:large subunit ribosomal protein L15
MMSAILTHLAPPAGSKRNTRRCGRGSGTGLGKTAGRGQKGQKARSTGNIGKKHFQGGQTPIQRRLPKRGFRNPFAIRVSVVKLSALEQFAADSTVDEAMLRSKRLFKGRDVVVKVLGDGELTKALTVCAHYFSGSATAKIETAGGKAVVMSTSEKTAKPD